MQTATALAALQTDGALLVAAAERAGWESPVPGLTWTVRQLLVHTGAVHRWSTDIVQRRLQTNETGGSTAFHPRLADDALAAWYREGLDALVTTLSDAPDDLDVWTFAGGGEPRHFWCRRQAHETAIHRADAQGAAGSVTAFDAALAQDGLAEVIGFSRSRSFATHTTGRLGLLADDGDCWLVTFGGERIVGRIVGRIAGRLVKDADATVRGTSSDLYRWAWNRPSPAIVSGDARVAALWGNVRIE